MGWLDVNIVNTEKQNPIMRLFFCVKAEKQNRQQVMETPLQHQPPNAFVYLLRPNIGALETKVSCECLPCTSSLRPVQPQQLCTQTMPSAGQIHSVLINDRIRPRTHTQLPVTTSWVIITLHQSDWRRGWRYYYVKERLRMTCGDVMTSTFFLLLLLLLHQK